MDYNLVFGVPLFLERKRVNQNLARFIVTGNFFYKKFKDVIPKSYGINYYYYYHT